MCSSILGLVLAAASVGQQAAAPEAAWLKAVPADIDAVLHLRSAQGTRDDLLAMVRAMSPTVADQAEPILNAGFEQMAQQAPRELTGGPVLALVRLPEADAAGGMPPLALLATAKDVPALVKLITRVDDPKAEPQTGGYVKYQGAAEDLYLYEGDGFVAFAPNPEIVKAIAARPGTTLDSKLSAEQKAQLLGGDVGAYVNLGRIQEQYGETIAGAREAFMGMLDQAGGQMQPGQMEQAKQVYSALFDTLKDGDALALNLDFDAKALKLSGVAAPKADTASAKRLASAHVGAADQLASLPADALLSMYLNVDPEQLSQLQNLGAGNFGPAPDSPAAKKALEALKAAGRSETYSAMTFDGGMNVVGLSYPADPQAMLKAMIEGAQGSEGSPMVKSVKVQKDAQTYKGISFSQTSVTVDLEKMAEAQGDNPAAVAAVKQMFGGDTLNTWLGIHDKAIISVMAPTWEKAQARLETVLGGTGGLGGAEGFKAARAMLPEQVSGLGLVNAQQVVRQIAQLVGSMTGNAIGVPADMPKAPAYFGGSIASSPAGSRFDFVLPSTVGPVLEKGLAPLIQGLQGQINQ